MRHKILLMVLLSIAFSSCERMLDLKPENSLTFSNAIETEGELESSLYTLQSYVRMNMALSTNWQKPALWGEYADSLRKNTAAGLLLLDRPTNYVVSWKDLYTTIAMANVSFRYINDVKMSDERRKFYLGEIYFTKAFVYLDLVRRWGDCVIVYDDVNTDPVPKSSWVAVTDHAIDLAQKAVDLLPEFPELKDSKGAAIIYKSTPSKGAALGLLAHLCAWKAGCQYMAQPQDRNYDTQALWARVEDACTKIINSGVYRLAADPETVCTSVLVGDDKESIYEATMRGFWNELDALNKQSNAFSFAATYQTYPAVTGSKPADVAGLQNWVKPASIKTMYAAWQKNGVTVVDKRRAAWFYDLVKTEALPIAQTKGFAYPNKWRLARTSTGGGTAAKFVNYDQNRIWFRLADFILLRAESRARLNNQGGAIADLNMIRDRAGAEPYKASEGDVQKAVYREREKELFLEGSRWFDILRNGYYSTELYGGFRQVSQQDILDGVFFNGIDDTEFTKNPLVHQNQYWFSRL